MRRHEDPTAIERACAALVRRFAYHLDNRHYHEVLALFADDGCFARPGVEALGQEQLRRWLEERPPEIETRHVCCEPVFLAIRTEDAQSVTTFTLFQAARRENGFPVFDRPAAIAEFHDRFRLVGEGWRIAERRVKVAMVAGG